MENKKILFMIIRDEVLLLEDDGRDHKEWYDSLGEDKDLFDDVIRGFVIKDKMIFFKAFFNYDDDVIKCAKKYAITIRNMLNNNDLKVYCGILTTGAYNKWEPILEIGEEELDENRKGKKKKVKKDEEILLAQEKIKGLDVNNDYTSDDYTRLGFAISMIFLGLSMMVIGIAISSENLQFKSMGDAFLVFLQFALLIVVLVGYKFKASFTKYCAFGVSLLMIFTFNVFEVILGILYFLFSVDVGYFTKTFTFIKNFIKKNLMKKKTS